MPISFLMDGKDRRTDNLLHDIKTWLHFHSRSSGEIRQVCVDDEDGADLKRITVEFRDRLDEADFWLWRGIFHRGRRS
jgi:hypothetical protein